MRLANLNLDRSWKLGEEAKDQKPEERMKKKKNVSAEILGLLLWFGSLSINLKCYSLYR